MKNILKYIIFILPILFYSCSNTGKVKKRDIIKKDKFVEILTDIHKASGLIEFKRLQTEKTKADSVSLYNYILKKHNVSREKFKKTVEYYAEHNEEYLKIYDEISSKLEAEQNRLSAKVEQEKKEEFKHKTAKGNLLDIKNEWKLPDDGKTNPIPFSVKTNIHGTYILKAKIKLYPDDKSVNPRMTLIANYSDGSKSINSNGTMVKDGKFEEFDVSIETDKNKKLTAISGWLLDHSRGTKTKHAEVKDISLTRIIENKFEIK